MRWHAQWFVAIHILCGISSRSLALVLPNTSPPTIVLKAGTLQGVLLDGSSPEIAFLGVPYAAAPVGENRWKPPQPMSNWTGTRKATDFGKPCPQLPAAWFADIGWSEDCLYLNIWTPDLSSTARRPVLVYFHGGSNTQGYSQMTPLGPALSQQGLVVVSPNYRLGPFGFLAHPALTAESEHHSSGNYGLLDQLQALRWVSQNIQQFGGDPSRVTVMGQSAGAVDICLLMSSPLAIGLFQRAIMESGECEGTLTEDIHVPIQYNLIATTGERAGQRLAADLGVGNGPDTIRKLRNLPAAEILDAWSRDPNLHFDAIVDGWLIPEQPARIFARGAQLHVPILVGSNANEATVFGHGGPKTVEKYMELLRRDTGRYSEEEFRAYPVNSDSDVRAQYRQLESDTFAYGALSIARAMTQAHQKAYLYYFTYADTGDRAALGAHHGEELYFLSDTYPNDWQPRSTDRALGKLIRGYWVQFASTGNPNSVSAPRWLAYDEGAPGYFEIGERVGVHVVPKRIEALDRIMQRVVTMPVVFR